MDINTLIDELLGYCKYSNKTVDKEIIKSYQQEYLNGYSPLLYWKTDDEKKASNYYEKLVEILKSEDYNVLIGFCKSGL